MSRKHNDKTGPARITRAIVTVVCPKDDVLILLPERHGGWQGLVPRRWFHQGLRRPHRSPSHSWQLGQKAQSLQRDQVRLHEGEGEDQGRLHHVQLPLPRDQVRLLEGEGEDQGRLHQVQSSLQRAL